ncbi:hypothetical protein BGZ93_004790, partial [Podila epicladia]
MTAIATTAAFLGYTHSHHCLPPLRMQALEDDAILPGPRPTQPQSRARPSSVCLLVTATLRDPYIDSVWTGHLQETTAHTGAPRSGMHTRSGGGASTQASETLHFNI